MQEDLDRIKGITDGKCKVLSVERGNPHNRYTIKNEALVGSEYGKILLGVIVSYDTGLRKQWIGGSNKANRVLGLILRSVKSRSPEVILKLYLAIVRPHLDYHVQFFSPHYRKDIKLLESLQRKISKRIQGMRKYPYGARL